MLFRTQTVRLSLWIQLVTCASLLAADDFIPRRQSRVPGPPLTPEQALEKFTVPAGFKVELVASEPQIMNPVAMAFDDRGRIYVTESFEYPRQEPGPGRDRIKILEDTDADGKIDSVKIFAEDLNIPSAIAVGHGGVWVANAPDLLFLEDTDGDDKADKQTVVVTGFGRFDTHELPSAFTWGPDGYLYGLNGVFNPAKIEQNGRKFDFTCAMFRVHPRTKQFELFCEGTSNPWGIAFDPEGSAFISACVIDHLWHLTETGYYHRQGGPYPPHTWKAESIVKHQHQMAAYCGIEYFDSQAYPEAYRDKLYMGNIHGSCINVDRIERSGATYAGFGEPDFMTADDVWFMPVVQKVGPDGCLYVLDWYDRYHCYQDAQADPKGIDRGHGRLYRVVYEKRPQIQTVNFAELPNDQLAALLVDGNIYNRQHAQLELAERSVITQDLTIAKELFDRTIDDSLPLKHRMHSLWAIIGSGRVPAPWLLQWLQTSDPAVRAWGVRVAGDQQTTNDAVQQKVSQLAADSDPRVRLQVAIAANKLFRGDQATALLLNVLTHSQRDPILPRVVWQNLLPHLVSQREAIQGAIAKANPDSTLLAEISPRAAARWIEDVSVNAAKEQDVAILTSIASLANALTSSHPDAAAATIDVITERLVSRQLRFENLSALIDSISTIDPGKTEHERLTRSYDRLQILMGTPSAIERAESKILSLETPADVRSSLLQAVAISSPKIVSKALHQTVDQLIAGKTVDTKYRDTVINLGLEAATNEDIAYIANALAKLEGGLQATLTERLSQRPATAVALLLEIEAGRVRKEMVSPNQLRLLAKSPSPQLQALVKLIWGTVQTNGSEQRQQVVQQMTKYLTTEAKGDAKQGWAVYDRICGQCHVMHNRGYEVGPNITSNGRGNFEQLIVSVFDPSLVIGEAYKSYTVLTQDGRTVNGLLVEQTPQRVVLKLQGNKQETIATEDIDELKQNANSLMPEGIEQQLTKQELADLFALLSLSGPPEAADNQTIQSTPAGLHK